MAKTKSTLTTTQDKLVNQVNMLKDLQAQLAEIKHEIENAHARVRRALDNELASQGLTRERNGSPVCWNLTQADNVKEMLAAVRSIAE